MTTRSPPARHTCGATDARYVAALFVPLPDSKSRMPISSYPEDGAVPVTENSQSPACRARALPLDDVNRYTGAVAHALSRSARGQAWSFIAARSTTAALSLASAAGVVAPRPKPSARADPPGAMPEDALFIASRIAACPIDPMRLVTPTAYTFTTEACKHRILVRCHASRDGGPTCRHELPIEPEST